MADDDRRAEIEAVACPRCHASAGEPCTRAAARGTARYAIGSAGVPLKHPHSERRAAAVRDARGDDEPVRFTHVCMDCGALGVAGGYHDHGDGNAGDTIALAALPDAIRSLQQFEQRAHEAEEELAARSPQGEDHEGP